MPATAAVAVRRERVVQAGDRIELQEVAGHEHVERQLQLPFFVDLRPAGTFFDVL